MVTHRPDVDWSALTTQLMIVSRGRILEPRLRVAGCADGAVSLRHEVAVGVVLLQLPAQSDADDEEEECVEHFGFTATISTRFAWNQPHNE